jgi:hypothetical protein
MDQIAGADLAQLVEVYRTSAQQHGVATERGDYKAANIAAELLAALYSELRRRAGGAA